MEIRAMIMAGGEGSRLRPMTMHLPKPLVPLMGRPVMGYALNLLKQHGIEDVGVTLWYQPKKIRAAFGRGDKLGMRIQYFEETEPLGTAGSILLAREKLKDTFFILSGDGLTDCDLTKAMAFHKEKKALATLVLKRVNIPLAYGVVMCDPDGQIIRFVEKPDWSGVYSNLANTGIYILEPEVLKHIPDKGMPDFGKDIFPALLKNKERLYGYEMDGYWCDVGNAGAYLQAQRDMLEGKVKLSANTGVHPDAKIGENVRLQGNFSIGKGTIIESGALIRDSVIGENCVIGRGAVVEESCLWDYAAVGVKGCIAGSVLCDGATVRSESSIADGCVLGQGVSVGAHAHLHRDVKVWPGLRIPSGAVCRENVFRDDAGVCAWEEMGAVCLSPGLACRVTGAYVRALHPRRVLTGYMDAKALQTVANGTLAAAGVKVLQGEWMTLDMLQEAVAGLKLDGGVLARDEQLIFVDGKGRIIDSRVRRNMDAILLSGEGNGNAVSGGRLHAFSGTREMYLAHCVPEEKKALFSPIIVYCRDKQVLDLALEGLQRMNARNVKSGQEMVKMPKDEETAFVLSRDGGELTCFTKDGEIEKTQLLLLRLKCMAQGCINMYDGPDIPRAALTMGAYVPFDESEACIRQGRHLRDGIKGLWDICSAMKEGTLALQLMDLPAAHIVCREVACREGDKSRILYELWKRTDSPYTLSKGLQVKNERGYATIVPDNNRPAVRIFGESTSMETAGELCDFYDRAIRQLLQKETDF